MGITGIYKEVGPGKRISLSKLASNSFQEHGRPLRIAIDSAIWQFQTQAGKGGVNADLRTFFYRLARLLATPVEPIFVFDGPNKPNFKRNHSSRLGESARSFTAAVKRLIQLFGFVCHDAPGEAEAECALLQQRGLVDVVLSEDVDTIMFGCTRTLRKWTSEKKSSKTPTHVSMYDTEDMSLKELGLGREGMVLVALMSGGDYNTEGLPGCGPKVACEAAKAGFGTSLCRLKAADKAGFNDWRQRLEHELHTNESGHFRTKHKALTIPKDFPDLQVLRYYTHPVVSSNDNLKQLERKLQTSREMDIVNLRQYARETFDWNYREGGVKFIRVISPAFFMQKLNSTNSLLKEVKGQRSHFDTDGTPELRVTFIPSEVVPLDLSDEEPAPSIEQSRSGLALNSDNEAEMPLPEVGSARTKTFDIHEPLPVWVLEQFLRHTAPSTVSRWEERQALKEAQKAAKAKPQASKGRKTKKKDVSDMPQGAMNQFVKITKVQPTGKPPRLAPPTSPSKPSIQSHHSGDLPQISDPARLQSAPRTPFKTRMDSPIIISSSPACPGSSDLRTSPPAATRSAPYQEKSSQDPPSHTPALTSLASSDQPSSPSTRAPKGTRGANKTKATKNSITGRGSQTRLESFFRPSQTPSSSPSSKPKLPPVFIWPKDDDFDSDSDSEVCRPTIPSSPVVGSALKASPTKAPYSWAKGNTESLPRAKSPSKSQSPIRISIPKEHPLDHYQELVVGGEKTNLDRALDLPRHSDVEVIDLTGEP